MKRANVDTPPPVKFYSKFLPATPTCTCIISYFFSQISYKHHDMHFLAPPPIKRIRRSFYENQYRQTYMTNLPYFMIISTRRTVVCNGFQAFVTFLKNRLIKLNYKFVLLLLLLKITLILRSFKDTIHMHVLGLIPLIEIFYDEN